MSHLVKVGQRFLNESNKQHVKDLLGMLESFMEQLENKNDPTSKEIKLAEEIYQFFEKYKTLEATMRDYVTKESSNPNSDKLYELLEKRTRRNW